MTVWVEILDSHACQETAVTDAVRNQKNKIVIAIILGRDENKHIIININNYFVE